jgi:hypothetical protein
VWVRADQLKPGDKIAFLATPWETGDSHTHGYLKGMADGEGCVDKNRACVGVSQLPGPVFEETGIALSSLGFQAKKRHANGRSDVLQWEIYGTAQCMRFLGEVRPTRLLTKAENIYNGKAMSGGMGKMGAQTHATVISAEPEGIAPVVTLETTTGTLITEGLCSHNTGLPFSAARMSRIRHWERVNGWRWNMVVPQFLDPVWSWMVEAAGIVGVRIEARTDWNFPPLPMIEPDKEGLAIMRNIRAGIQTLRQAVRERGMNYDQFLDELQNDFAELDKRGLVLDIDPRHMTQAGQAQMNPLDPAAPTGESE